MKIYRSHKELPIGQNVPWNRAVRGAFEDIEDWHVGGNAFILKKDKLEEYFPQIRERYPNLPITVKVNHKFINKGFEMNRYIIKNIAWLNGFAPRVYEVVWVRDPKTKMKYHAHIMEYVDGPFATTEEGYALWDKYELALQKYQVGRYGPANEAANFIGGKLVDFDEFCFLDKGKYGEELKERYQKIAYWGSEAAAYQDIPFIGVKGCRSYDRYEKFGMLDMDLKGKTVLDIGCSGGQVLYWARERGAKRIVGLDKSEIASVTFEMANFHEYFNIETIGCDLTQDNIQQLVREKTGLDKFDIVTIFSMNQHIGFHQYMRDLCGGTLFLETNAGQMPEIEMVEYPQKFREMGYTSFEYKGQVNESGGRSLFICQ
jgi:hypothetical protein